MSHTLIHNEKENKYEYHIGGHVAYITYEDNNGVLGLTHTIVPDALAGQGLAKKLLIDVLETIKKDGKKAKAECSYIVAFEGKNPDYGDVFAK